MKTLSTEGYKRARGFIVHHGRALEQARFALAAGGGTVDAVVEALERYRNPDGGFGHALEPDQRSAGSSVLAATEALAVMADLGLPEDDRFVEGVMAWLLSNVSGMDPETRVWPYLPGDLDDAPSAPWWNLDGLGDVFGGFLVNPKARILSFFYRWRGLLDRLRPGLVELTTQDVLSWCSAAGEVASPDALRSLVMLADAPHVPEGIRSQIVTHVTRMIPASVTTDPEKWGEYGIQPCEVADSPDSRWVPVLGESVPAHLDHLVASQQEDGSWAPFWNWGAHFPDVWRTARREWSGILTLRYLKVLSAFGRMPPA